MKGKEDIWENENWTQNEVAEYFKVVPSTIKNWRDRGLLRYWQAPGTAKVLFDRDDIRDFRDKHIISKKGDDKPKVEIKKVKPSVSSEKKIWEII
jgi:hypothetical protein